MSMLSIFGHQVFNKLAQELEKQEPHVQDYLINLAEKVIMDAIFNSKENKDKKNAID